MRLLQQVARRCCATYAKGSFEREMAAKIKLTGPMSIAQFMQEVLTNPFKGYYTTKENVLGSSGDFITSPEISQMFGECIAIWIIHEWRKMGSVRPLQLVELGPGHGTLMGDILKTAKKLVPEELPHFSVHLVEASDRMKKMQETRLLDIGPKVNWYDRLNEVPRGFTFFVANEFFDALPIHKFVRDPSTKGWQEILVDITKDDSLALVKSRAKTLANHYVDNEAAYEKMDAIEISPKSGAIMETISDRIVEDGGAALIADYGNDQMSTQVVDTFRAFKGHQLSDPLKDLGEADLTADVDFEYLKRKTSKHALAFGPVSQNQFLTQLGIVIRCNLLKEANPQHAQELQKSLDFLVDPQKMGERFKFLSIFPKTVQFIHPNYTPVGFHGSKQE